MLFLDDRVEITLKGEDMQKKIIVETLNMRFKCELTKKIKTEYTMTVPDNLSIDGNSVKIK